MRELLLISIVDGTGHIVLNQPRTINALNSDMIQGLFDTLAAWSQDDGVKSVVISGAGKRGFCAGADVRQLSELLNSGGPWLRFLELEYAVDWVMHSFPKPTRSVMHGVTMGGGLGLACKADHRVVDSGTVLAMPETKIGLFPDVGVMYQLSRAGGVGTHVALTSANFGGGDAILMDLADESSDGDLPTPLHDAADDWIEECYAGDDVLEIVNRLENHSHPDARKAAADLRERSPFAVHVTLRALRRAAGLDQAAVLDQDLRLAGSVLPVDFSEGVRALLIDRDNKPKWTHASLEEVPEKLVDIAFNW